MNWIIKWLGFRSSHLSQREIDEDAQRLIAEYGANAENRARSDVERAQWTKGHSTAVERSERILKAVQKELKRH